MNLPIKARLTLWYVMLFAIIVASWGAYITVRVRADLYAGIDRALASRATQLASVLRGSGTSAFKNASVSTLTGASSAETLAQLLSSAGDVVQHSGGAASASRLAPEPT